MSLRHAFVIGIAFLGMTSISERRLYAQTKAEFALCLQLDNGTKFYINFTSQGNATLASGREGAAGFPDPTGVMTGSVMTSNIFHGFPANASAIVNIDIALTTLYVNNPMDVSWTSANTVFTFPLPFTGTGVYRRTLIPASAGGQVATTSGSAKVCTTP
jgi:hypothetical protein